MYQIPIRVTLSCTKEFINEEDVEFIDISEDSQGRDKLTFKCPKCGETHTSYRLG